MNHLIARTNIIILFVTMLLNSVIIINTVYADTIFSNDDLSRTNRSEYKKELSLPNSSHIKVLVHFEHHECNYREYLYIISPNYGLVNSCSDHNNYRYCDKELILIGYSTIRVEYRTDDHDFDRSPIIRVEIKEFNIDTNFVEITMPEFVNEADGLIKCSISTITKVKNSCTLSIISDHPNDIIHPSTITIENQQTSSFNISIINDYIYTPKTIIITLKYNNIELASKAISIIDYDEIPLTHPDSTLWYISNDLKIKIDEKRFKIPFGYYYSINNESTTQVSISNSTYEPLSCTTISEGIAITHGTHYLHFSPSNSDYWPTETFHFQYNHFNQQLIVESETHPDPNQFYPLPDISINIKNLEPGIIIRYIVDQNSETIPNTSSSSKDSEQFSLNVRSPGTYYLHVRAEDSLGNIALEELTTHFRFNLSTQPITSKTHPVATEWSSNNNVQINIAGWKTGMKYRYLIDHQSDGIPIENSNIITSENATMNIPFPGINYIHVRAIDPQGNIFPEDSTSHYRVNIFPTLPKIESTTHPNQNEWYTLPNIAIEFIHTAKNIKLRYIVNEQPGTIPDDSATLKSSQSFVLPGQSPGTHYIHIRAEHTDGTLDPAYLTAHFRYNLLASGESPPTALPKIDNLSVTPTIVSNSESITIQADVIIDK